MDLLAHALWTYIIFDDATYLPLAILFSILPDLIAFGPYMVYKLVTMGRKLFHWNNAEEFVKSFPNYIFTVYNLTHSVIVFGIVFCAVWFVRGSMPLFLLGWLFHILMDIPTHSPKLFPVKFLYPLSKYSFPGINWHTKWVLAANWTSILLILLLGLH